MDRVRTSEILEYENIDTNEYHHSDFEINCDENGFKSNSFNFYKTFNNKQEAYDYIENF